ncbi:hypothetical protein FA95DRAFT_1558677 [Auriscalpium vulgare]|uniref:Uncharacterized protein n=1 Tax=Auriscalpium vulgare TaxID=40419 RepID=A0ACB8RVH2_9AGAM|nr:hypothetical protein FA95DRAFT_1558677 [Auriscalpium vulgare]
MIRSANRASSREGLRAFGTSTALCLALSRRQPCRVLTSGPLAGRNTKLLCTPDPVGSESTNIQVPAFKTALGMLESLLQSIISWTPGLLLNRDWDHAK